MLPKRINVMKVITYDVTEIVGNIKEEYKDDSYTPSIEEVLDWMTEWVIDDFDQPDYNGLIFQDENGEKL